MFCGPSIVYIVTLVGNIISICYAFEFNLVIAVSMLILEIIVYSN